MNTNRSTSQSGLFTPRLLVALALCSCGVLLGMFSLAATPLSELGSSPSRKPAEAPSANTSLPADPRNFLSTSGNSANRLPPGVPLPSGANSLGNPGLANQQPAPLSVPQPAVSEGMPLASAAAGTWSIVPSPNPPPTESYNFLTGVTCVSASNCWAVGYSNTTNQTLIERWDGTSWAIVSSPNISGAQNFLLGVTCVSASNCWAVGYYVGSDYQTLIERWDGTSWAIVSSPNTTVQYNVLNGVTCVSASNCWAVGSYVLTGIDYQPLIEHWDGSSWAIVISLNTNVTQSNVLRAVTCVSASNCWAVGAYYTGNFQYQTLIERWDGTLWAIVTSPNNLSTQPNVLNGVTCASASDCWAVGSYLNSDTNQTLIEHWDGTSWAVVISANTSGADDNFLSGVTCASASECWAVGHYFSVPKLIANQTLIERWDGTSWAIVSSPNISNPQGLSQDHTLNSVTCVSASECWAVGRNVNSQKGQAIDTLVLRYTASLQVVSVVSRMSHGSAGTFDIDLPLTGTRGIECRSSASLGAGSYTMVFTFLNPVTNCGSASTGAVTSGPNPNQCTVNLTGVPNAQYLTVTLTGAVDSTGATGSVSGTMGVLVGDVNATGLVDGNDVSAVQGKARQPANSANFRLDVNTTGLIDGNDVSLVQSKTRTSLPSPP